eukprot:1157468-Pelagomonas_calceolata.AAC.8
MHKCARWVAMLGPQGEHTLALLVCSVRQWAGRVGRYAGAAGGSRYPRHWLVMKGSAQAKRGVTARVKRVGMGNARQQGKQAPAHDGPRGRGT